jgi:hypothetical protein
MRMTHASPGAPLSQPGIVSRGRGVKKAEIQPRTRREESRNSAADAAGGKPKFSRARGVKEENQKQKPRW